MKRPNIVYMLGAGASYSSLPIWKAQGESMQKVSIDVLNRINGIRTTINENQKQILKNDFLNDFFNQLNYFSTKAIEYGSIDIYAKRLTLINNVDELNKLKHCLSVYFDLWEDFYHNRFSHPEKTLNFENQIPYEKIDKRYFSLLSVLLEKENDLPKLNQNVSFITWNYDLQIESAFETFLPNKKVSIIEINDSFKFHESKDKRKIDVLHLNGFRGCFYENDNLRETVERKNKTSIDAYLAQLIQNDNDFKNANYKNSIRYAWEASTEMIDSAKKIMSEADILIIIGYSFPAYNRLIDSELIKCFDKGAKQVFFQNPYNNIDIVNSLFKSSTKKTHISDNNQFYIPHDYLFQTEKPITIIG